MTFLRFLAIPGRVLALSAGLFLGVGLGGCAHTTPPGSSVLPEPVAALPILSPTAPDQLRTSLSELLRQTRVTSTELEPAIRDLDRLAHPNPAQRLQLAQGLLLLDWQVLVPRFRNDPMTLLNELDQDPQVGPLRPLVRWLQAEGTILQTVRTQRNALSQQLHETQGRVEILNTKIQELKAIEHNLVSRPLPDPSDHGAPRH